MTACTLISLIWCKVHYPCFQTLDQFRGYDGCFWFRFGHSLQEGKGESAVCLGDAGNGVHCRSVGISGLWAVLYEGCWYQGSIITVFYLDLGKQHTKLLAAIYTVQANLSNKSCDTHWLYLTSGHQLFTVLLLKLVQIALAEVCWLSLAAVVSRYCMLMSSDWKMKKSRLSVCQCAASAWMHNPLKSNRLAKSSKYQGKVVPTVVSLTTVWALFYVEEIGHNQPRRKELVEIPLL